MDRRAWRATDHGVTVDVTERALSHCEMGVVVAPFHSGELRGFIHGKQ